MAQSESQDSVSTGGNDELESSTLPIDPGPSRPRRSAKASGPARPVRAAAASRGASQAAALTPGDLLEIRLANIWFAEGAFSRRGVALRYADAGETKDITDVDLYAIRLDGALRSDLTIGEAKSGTGKSAPKPIDRSMWLRGLSALTGASHAELTMAGPVSARERRLASDLGVSLQTIADVERREKGSVVGQFGDVGPHSEAIAELRESARRSAGSDPDLLRTYQYLRGDVWFAEPWAATKRLLATIRILSSRLLPDVRDAEQSGLRWMTGESIVAFSLVAARLAGQALHSDPGRLRQETSERLAEGAAPANEMRHLSESVDQYLTAVLDRHGVPRTDIVAALGAFTPTPPQWSEAFSELLLRLAGDLAGTRQLPRYADLLVSEALLRGRGVDPAVLDLLELGGSSSGRSALRAVLAFLEGQAGLPRHVVDTLSR